MLRADEVFFGSPNFSLCDPALIKKENKIFLIYKEIQRGAVGKSYMRKVFLTYEEMHKYLVIFKEAVSHVFPYI
jgi:hypothetical protein